MIFILSFPIQPRSVSIFVKDYEGLCLTVCHCARWEGQEIHRTELNESLKSPEASEQVCVCVCLHAKVMRVLSKRLSE